MCGMLRSTALLHVLFSSGRLIDTSANKVNPDDMEPEVDEGDYLGDLAEEEDDARKSMCAAKNQQAAEKQQRSCPAK